MANIEGGFKENEAGDHQEARETQETQETQKKHKKKNYRKKYKNERKDCEKLRTKNKLLRQKMKYEKKLQVERETRCRAEGKVEACEEIFKHLVGSKCPAELPDYVLEVEGEVRDA